MRRHNSWVLGGGSEIVVDAGDYLSMFDVRNQVPLLIFGPDATGGEFTPREEKLPALQKMLGDLEEQLR